MPSIPLHPPPHGRSNAPSNISNPLPQLLQTPSGLAILELQGTINLPSVDPSELPDAQGEGNPFSQQTLIGTLVFPDYSSSAPQESTAWMKKVYLYVGRHQRLTGEVKRLAKPLAVIRRKDAGDGAGGVAKGGKADVDVDAEEELEIVEVVYYKILFSSRPEPVGEGM